MIYSGSENPAFELTDLASLVVEMLDLLKISISKHAVLETSLSEGLPAVYASPAQIRQVVMNLVTNASEAIGERDGVIRVTIDHVTGAWKSAAADCLKLEISDTGCGMAPEVRARIFDPFFTTKFTGRGLGLATVQAIVRTHGGKIHVDTVPGQGTRVEILLPCTNQAAKESRHIGFPANSAGNPADCGTILVVEDEVALRVPVSKMLRSYGFSVMEAGDGLAAVDLFRAHANEITVVLLDMTLPGLSGPEVFAELCRIQPRVNVVLTSAHSKESFLSAFAGQPAARFVRKTYGLDELVALVRDACPQLP